MDIMSREEPLFRKCCVVIPLRLCLQTWGYIKLVADLLALSYLVLVIILLNSFIAEGFFKALLTSYELFLLLLLVLALLADVGFLIALIVGVFKKSIQILRVFYFYEFYVIGVETIIITLLCMFVFQVDVLQGVIYVTVGILYILLELCIMMSLKSEMIKLRDKEQYDFFRMPVCETDIEGTCKFKANE